MNKQKQGISLVVLVITIIVMLVLASAVIITLSNTNIINKAKEAVDMSSEKEVETMAKIAWTEGYADKLRGEELKKYVKTQLKNQGVLVEDYVIKVTDEDVMVLSNTKGWVYAKDSKGRYTMVKRGKDVLEIGDYINNYIAEGTEYTGKWMVLGAGEDGSLLIISEKVTETLVLNGKDGLVNGITFMDAACSKYVGGKEAKKARNIRINEINKLTGYNPNNIGVYDPDGEGYGETAGGYGEEISYYWKEDTAMSISTGTNSIPSKANGKFYFFDEGKLKELQRPEDVSDESKRFIMKQLTKTYHYGIVRQGIEKGSKIYNVICPGENETNIKQYWIANYVNTYMVYGFFKQTNEAVSTSQLLSVGGIEAKQSYTGIRPVVELNPQVELEGNSKDGWTII